MTFSASTPCLLSQITLMGQEDPTTYLQRGNLDRAFAFAGGGLAAAESLHTTLLAAVVRAPISFFDSVSTGETLHQ